MTTNKHTEQSEREEFDVVIQALEKHRDRLLEMNKHSGTGIMGSIRWKQIDELENALQERKAAALLAADKGGPIMQRGTHADGTPWVGTMRECLEDAREAAQVESAERRRLEALLDADSYEGSDRQRLDDLVHALTGDDGEDDSLKVLERVVAELSGRTVRELLSTDKAGGEPVAYMWQHDETGRTGFISADQIERWEEINPRLKIVAPCYTQPQAVPDDVVKDAEFEVWQVGEVCAGASGPREQALREAMRYAAQYAAQYAQDGPVQVFEVRRTAVDAAMLKEWKV